MPPPWLTLTGNLLSERTLEFAAWSAGRTQRASRETFQVGGKGINVSKMLHRLGVPTTALCFTGGASGAECEQWLGRQAFGHQAFRSSRPTRSGVVIRGGPTPETTFLGPDVAPDAAAVRACADFLDAQPAGLNLAVCGSLPGWASADFDPLRAAIGRWLQRGRLAADSYGPPLVWLAAQPLDLVKINDDELRTLFPSEPPGTATPGLLAAAAQRWPARRWIVTNGRHPVWFCAAPDQPASAQPPAVTEVSATGSGDVFFASVLATLGRSGSTLAAAVATALPYAAANAAHPGIADFPDP